jgi:RNA polymerase sigma factor (sigma-70 family)
MPPQTATRRPTRAEINPAALALIEKHGAAILSTARKYSLSAEDAEDAYQRGLEILLTKAPSTDEDDLVPWLKTVVKHEAFAIRRHRKRTLLVGDEQQLMDPTSQEPPAELHAERLERLRLGAEAMSRLKPQEIRCLVLRAEGYSYAEIAAATGWSLTKVNRSLTEGRSAFRRRVAGIEAGAECERLAPLVSRLADGEASSEDLRALRPHLRGCLSCRATLRDYREAPSWVAGAMPAVAGGGSGLFGSLAETVAFVKTQLLAVFARPGGTQDVLAAAGAGALVGKGLAVLCIGGAAVGGVCIETGVLGKEPRRVTVGKSPEQSGLRTSRPATLVDSVAVPGRRVTPQAHATDDHAATPRRPAQLKAAPPPAAEEFGFERAGTPTSTSPQTTKTPATTTRSADNAESFSFER